MGAISIQTTVCVCIIYVYLCLDISDKSIVNWLLGFLNPSSMFPIGKDLAYLLFVTDPQTLVGSQTLRQLMP